MTKKPKQSKAETVAFSKIELEIQTKKTPFIPKTDTFTPGGADDLKLEEIAACIKLNKPVLLEGPTGSGKTSLVRHLAIKTNNSYRRTQLNGGTSRENFVGQMLLDADGGTYWVDGILTEAMKKGYWLLVDEINAALPEITMILNSVLDDDRVLVIEENGMEIVTPHENFRLFAAMNPSDEYAGTKELNMALKNRFQTIHYDYPDKKQEVAILCRHSGLTSGFGKRLLPRMVDFAQAIRTKKEESQISGVCSTRQLINWVQLMPLVGIKRACQISVVNNADADERDKYIDELNKLFADDESYEEYLNAPETGVEEDIEEVPVADLEGEDIELEELSSGTWKVMSGHNLKGQHNIQGQNVTVT